MALAQFADVDSRHIGEPFDSQMQGVINVRLDDAERRLKKQIPDLIDQANADADYAEDVKEVESEMVLRLIRNPDGYLQESEGSYSYMRLQKVASGELKVLDEEWARLGYRRGSFTIKPRLNLPWTGEDTTL